MITCYILPSSIFQHIYSYHLDNPINKPHVPVSYSQGVLYQLPFTVHQLMNLETHSYLYKFLAKTEKKIDNLLVAKQYSLPVSTHMQYYHTKHLVVFSQISVSICNPTIQRVTLLIYSTKRERNCNLLNKISRLFAKYESKSYTLGLTSFLLILVLYQCLSQICCLCSHRKDLPARVTNNGTAQRSVQYGYPYSIQVSL